jgi:hypothetical protein
MARTDWRRWCERRDDVPRTPRRMRGAWVASPCSMQRRVKRLPLCIFILQKYFLSCICKSLMDRTRGRSAEAPGARRVGAARRGLCGQVRGTRRRGAEQRGLPPSTPPCENSLDCPYKGLHVFGGIALQDLNALQLIISQARIGISKHFCPGAWGASGSNRASMWRHGGC